MKTPNRHLSRLVTVSTAAGFLAPSCVPYENEISVLSESLPSKGLHAIEMDFSKEEIDYLMFIDKLGKDIIEYPIIAQEFAKNPQVFLEKYGYTEPVDLEDKVLKLIMALGDEDINKALLAGDIRMALHLMEDKNLLTDIENSYSNLQLTEEQSKQLLILMGFEEEEIDCYACTPIVCILVVAVGIYAVVATMAAGALAVYGAAGLWTAVETYGFSQDSAQLLEDNSFLKIWSLKGKPEDTFLAVDLYVEKQIDKLLDTIKNYNGVNNQQFSEEKMKEFLKINYIMKNNL